MRFKNLTLAVLFSLGIAAAGSAKVQPAGVFGPGMVLQRDAVVKIYGTADKNEKIAVEFNGQSIGTRAGKDGRWSVGLAPMPAGGPYELVVAGKSDRVAYGDVLVGDVWLCSGQSNMEWPLSRAADAKMEMAAADYPMIRSLTVTKDISMIPKNDIADRWEVCTPETAGNFSAVGYFFARELHRELGIPIGIINSSWGGTEVEAWTSAGSYEALPSAVRRNYSPDIKKAILLSNTPEGEALKEKYSHDLRNDPALDARWYADDTGTSDWAVMDIPREWNSTPLAPADGHVWFRCEFDLPASAADVAGRISVGPVDDNEITWVNGIRVGATDGVGLPREYAIPAGVLRAGRNTVTVRVTDTGGGGGFIGRPTDLWVEAGGKRLPLAGEWKYKPSVISTDYGISSFGPNSYYSTLYNGMINPLTGFRIRGAIWYQGESNAGNARSYRTLFPNMILDWRAKWGYEFPFYWVQLANYMAEAGVPSDSEWAELREAQTMTLSLPRTGQAVIIDIGEAGDIHPRNKQDVGRRLALNALHEDYGRGETVWRGPAYASSDINGDMVRIEFDTCGSGLAVHNKYGYVEGFAVAGADRVFHWANARIDGNDRVVVWSGAVPAPVAVRFAWSDNPCANLFNREGLPAEPFRTDDWPGITK